MPQRSLAANPSPVPIALSFQTSRFDVSKEDPNPINPIFGQSLLRWLAERVPEALDMGEPDAEDWGWYSYVDWKGRQYLIGASTDDGAYWFLQADKVRTLKEKLLRRERMTEVDECLLLFKKILESEPDIRNVRYS